MSAPTSAPTVHHRVLLTWLAVYPAITVASLLLGPYTAHLPVYLRTFVLTALVVPVVVYGLMPLLFKGHAATIGRRRERAERASREAVRYSRKAVV
ncbi:hypothetical protein [Kitasatospora sp. MAP5-34]|uniref:hypothetical protein n=1 Tax=Kitasatospora sp. MAP5-34 TaxID=3035102 RepID=UPI0024747940|nr:hypothetical protein [Kitasatospora sp. MAP5-34]MDH6578230.1 antibiotic biosynthesis monooxygenase (ABM) superfamily enzyme [Kitasatospora sp. MAP5-34]